MLVWSMKNLVLITYSQLPPLIVYADASFFILTWTFIQINTLCMRATTSLLSQHICTCLSELSLLDTVVSSNIKWFGLCFMCVACINKRLLDLKCAKNYSGISILLNIKIHVKQNLSNRLSLIDKRQCK